MLCRAWVGWLAWIVLLTTACTNDTPPADDFAKADAGASTSDGKALDGTGSQDAPDAQGSNTLDADPMSSEDGGQPDSAAHRADASALPDVDTQPDTSASADTSVAMDAESGDALGDATGDSAGDVASGCSTALDCAGVVPQDTIGPCEKLACLAGQCGKTEVSAGPCDDGDPCTTGTNCVVGTCTGGVAAVCDDSNPCTSDKCMKGQGCTSTPAADGAGCGNGNSCLAGKCVQPGAPTFTIARGGLATQAGSPAAASYRVLHGTLLPGGTTCSGSYCVRGGLRP